MRAAFGIDQLHVDLYLVAEAPHAAFQDITDPKVLADLLHIDRFPFEAEGGAAGDHEAVGDAREVGGQILGDGVSEIFLLRIVGQIGKRQLESGGASTACLGPMLRCSKSVGARAAAGRADGAASIVTA